MTDYTLIAQRMERGETCASIANELGIHRTTLRLKMLRRGLTCSRRKPDGLTPQQIAIVRLMKAGRSHQQIANELRTSDTVVRTQLCRINLVRRAT